MSIMEIVSAAKRLHIGTVAWLALGIALVVGALSFGELPWLFSGFARHEEIAEVTREVQANTGAINATNAQNQKHWAIQLSDYILDLKEKECGLPKDAPKDVYARTIIKAAEEYRDLAGTPYNIPACGDL